MRWLIMSHLIGGGSVQLSNANSTVFSCGAISVKAQQVFA